MLGFALWFAVRFPKVAGVLPKLWGALKRHWKVVVAVVAIVAAWWWFTNWRDDLIETHDAAGYNRAQAEYIELVNAANEREAATQGRLDQMVIAFGGIATQREQAINLTVKPIIEGIQNEVANDPRYRECAVSGGLLDNLNAGRAAVDSGLAASNPRVD